MSAYLLESGIGIEMTSDGFPHHGVLSHQHFRGTAKRDTDLLHLFGSDIVGVDLKNSRPFIRNLANKPSKNQSEIFRCFLLKSLILILNCSLYHVVFQGHTILTVFLFASKMCHIL